jgi:hypothetical protein
LRLPVPVLRVVKRIKEMRSATAFSPDPVSVSVIRSFHGHVGRGRLFHIASTALRTRFNNNA